MRLKTVIFPVITFLAFAFVQAAGAQDIVTAAEYFDSISRIYADIEDYQASIQIIQDDSYMKGIISFKRPNLLRIDFEEPEDQVLAVDGELLTIYIPQLNVTMVQKLSTVPRTGAGGAAGLATAEGLRLLKAKYSVAFLEGPDPIFLDENSDEMVRKLKFEWKSIDEGFRQLEISISENGLIRRIDGITKNYQQLRMDLTSITINQNLPEGAFRYKSPPDANVIYDFVEPEA